MSAAMTAGGDRHVVMDVLRGFALFGVMLVNIFEFGGEGVLITAEQLAALPSAALDSSLAFWLRLFVYDKANTLFAFLFGLGFWIQMQRLEARGAPFKAIYLRRVSILLVVGLVHLLGVFAWDILHVYGVAAFVLFFCRKLPERSMLWLGLALLLFGKPVIAGLFAAAGISGPLEAIYAADSAVLARQAAAQSGDFAWFLALMASYLRLEWLLSGSLFSWIAYALGRFFMGAWVARQGWIQNAAGHLPMFRRWLWPLLLGGLLLEAVRLLLEDVAALDLLLAATHAVATPMIAAGYVCALVLIFEGRSLRWLVQPFAAVGQMALTNYLMQSIAIMLILTSAGLWLVPGLEPGLGLAGRAGISTFLPLVVAFFTAQIVFSHFWMKAFAFGPMEWLWRRLSYGKAPEILRSATARP